ncbi:MAG: UDP-2,3-diacylglucosamine diphosphatase [Candidatus Omnitrophica bacterium]|nr:UDP-2,3-diacylglucosamine diphosphatase [Candidatus Omnitrophota bacterium]
MKIFISDLHLGDGSRTDDFNRDKELLKFLEFVEDEAGELIIVGDLFELWQADMDRILFRHNEVVNKILSLRSKIRVTYVVGNHDYIPFIKFTGSGADICLEYNDLGSGIIAEHGHRYDVFNRYKNPLQSISWPRGRRFALLAASLERFVNRDADVWLEKALEKTEDFFGHAALVRNKITPSSEEYLKKGGHFGEFEKAVKEHINNGAKIVIFGHTHRCQLETIDKGIYANCGTWVDNATPTYIACHRDKVELREALSHKTIKQLPMA